MNDKTLVARIAYRNASPELFATEFGQEITMELDHDAQVMRVYRHAITVI